MPTSVTNLASGDGLSAFPKRRRPCEGFRAPIHPSVWKRRSQKLRAPALLLTCPRGRVSSQKRGERMGIKGRELADPGGRYAGGTGTSTLGRLAPGPAPGLDAGDARG